MQLYAAPLEPDPEKIPNALDGVAEPVEIITQFITLLLLPVPRLIPLSEAPLLFGLIMQFKIVTLELLTLIPTAVFPVLLNCILDTRIYCSAKDSTPVTVFELRTHTPFDVLYLSAFVLALAWSLKLAPVAVVNHL